MELVSNLVWLVVSAVLLSVVRRRSQRDALQVSPAAALTATFAVCLLLLPVISMSDDLLQSHQNELPLAAQTWHLASEGAAVGLEVSTLLGASLLLLFLTFMPLRIKVEPARRVRPHSAWLTRSQRLRPPPSVAP